MYDSYFKLSRSPFENTLDQRFFFLSEGHREVIAALLYFVRQKKAFAMVCGDVGTGKTIIVRHLLERLPPGVKPILVPYPEADYFEILRYVARELGVATKCKGVLELCDDVKAELAKASRSGRQVLLIIDEAHLLPVSSLENIRLLSNIELDRTKLLRVLLIGQSELAAKIATRELRQLRQRININRVLAPMGHRETTGYIDHRLNIAGSSFSACFDPGCRRLVYKLSGGVPRSINRLCDTALLICMTHRGKRVTKAILRKAQGALESDSTLRNRSATRGFSGHLKTIRAVAAAIALLVLQAALFWQYRARLENPAAITATHSNQGGRKTAEEVRKFALPVRVAGVPAKPAPKVAAPAASALPPPARTDLRSQPAPKAPVFRSLSPEKAGGDKTPSAGEASPRGPRQDMVSQKPQGHHFMVVTVKRGDSLTAIAAKWFPQNPGSGLKEIVAANPGVHDQNRILIDQTLTIPRK